MAGLHEYRRILAPNEVKPVTARGQLVVLRESTQPLRLTVREVETGQKEGQSYTITLRRGEKWYAAKEFDSVVVENISTETVTARLLIGFGDYEEPDRRVELFRGKSSTTFDGTNPSRIVSSNPLRHRVHVVTDPDNTTPINIGGSKLEVLQGKTIPIYPGGTFTGEATGELWGSTETADDVAFAMDENRADPDAGSVVANIEAGDAGGGEYGYYRGQSGGGDVGVEAVDINEDIGWNVRQIYLTTMARASSYIRFESVCESGVEADAPPQVSGIILERISNGDRRTLATANAETPEGTTGVYGVTLTGLTDGAYRLYQWDSSAHPDWDAFIVDGEEYKLTVLP